MFKKFTHNTLGWGYPVEMTENTGLPGATGEAICECGVPIIKDRGGWYHPYDSHTVIKEIRDIPHI